MPLKHILTATPLNSPEPEELEYWADEMEGGYKWRVEEFRETEHFEAVSGNVPICPPL